MKTKSNYTHIIINLTITKFSRSNIITVVIAHSVISLGLQKVEAITMHTCLRSSNSPDP
jgi:hypothetical protein